jgi:hypothetical protein
MPSDVDQIFRRHVSVNVDQNALSDSVREALLPSPAAGVPGGRAES